MAGKSKKPAAKKAARRVTHRAAAKPGKSRARNRTIIKAKRVTVLSANPRTRNAHRISPEDIKKFPPHMQAEYQRHWGKIEEKEEKAVTPAQKKLAIKSRRSFLARLGTRLRVMGQTKKVKVAARDLGRCPRKTIKVRARHDTDALAKAQAKLGDRYDQLKVQNGRRRPSAKKRRRNSAVGKLRETFSGQTSRKATQMIAPDGTPRDLAKLGNLISITAEKGTIVPARGASWLCADSKGHLHVASSEPRLVEGPARNFGEVIEVEYETAKPHLGHKKPQRFFHELGEEGGRRPQLVADGKGGLKFKGGSYRISAEGIID